jgi:hypothetical protein
MGDIEDYYAEQAMLYEDWMDQEDEFYKELERKEAAWIRDEQRAETVARRWELQFLKNIVLKREK